MIFLSSVGSPLAEGFRYTHDSYSQYRPGYRPCGLEAVMPLQHHLLSATTHNCTVRHILFGLLMIIGGYSTAFAGAAPYHSPSTQKSEGVFLVATEKLHGSSFQQTVILLTHYSKQGATGLAINRPAGIPLQQAFPGVRQLQQSTDPLYLGGPVSTNAIFVLLRTQQPGKTMHHIADDIYFSTGKNVFTHSFKPTTHTATRTYAGYAGWAAGQLQNEINRGDWVMVRTHPKIVFEEDSESLWQRLSKRWTGKWI